MKRIGLLFLAVLITVSSHAALLIDDAETGTAVNTLNGNWITYNDGHSSATFIPDSAPAYAGSYSRRMDWEMISGSTDLFAGTACGLNSSWAAVDMSAYYGLRFYAKGSGDYAVYAGEEETRADNNHYSVSITLTSSWKLYELPFSGFAQTWGTHQVWDPAKIFSIGFTASGAPGQTGALYFDNVEFYTQAEGAPLADPNVIILQPKVNQLGYLPAEKKYFTVVTNTASANDTFRIFDAGGNTAFTGTITGAPVDERQVSGEGVYKADFSGLTVPGTYHAEINGMESFTFRIAENVYDKLFKDALRCFYLIRCGTSVDDPITGLQRNACHTAPDTIRGGTGTRDLSGGWHNAGDLGKWCHEEAISCSYMLWLYELKKSKMKNIKNSIPESNNAVSDLLDEAKWGLDWLLKLQLPDGSVYHKSDTEPNFCFGTKPDLDPYVRYAAFQGKDFPQTPSSIDAAVFAAVMAQASRVYKDILPAYAAVCREAALKSWNWLKDHRGVSSTDPYYLQNLSAPGPTGWMNDPADTYQEEEWAMAEIYRLTGDPTVLSLFDADTNLHPLGTIAWWSPEFFGYFSLYQDPRTPQAIKDKIRTRIDALCGQLVNTANTAGYGVVNSLGDYYWESNENVMHKANNLLMGYLITGKTAYKDTALAQLGYILGNNSLNMVFVTKEGTNYNQHPYNWIYFDYGILFPGWASGGPNGNLSAYGAGGPVDAPLTALIKLGTPPAKCWLDVCTSSGSYASNEGETSANAALVFLSGFFLSSEDAEAGLDRAMLPVDKSTDVVAYPVPCDMRKGAAGITFANLPAGAELSIYNMSGELVHKAEIKGQDGIYFWELSELRRYKKLAAGVYVYSVADKKGYFYKEKIAIIR